MQTIAASRSQDALLVLADALDLVGITDRHHGRRVALIADAIAKRLDIDTRRRDRILVAGLVHDIGVSSTHVHDRLVAEDTWPDTRQHCTRGAALAQLLDLTADLAPVILHHHTPWSHASMASLPPEVRLEANLIFLADRIDAWLSPYGPGPREAFARARAGIGTTFAPEFSAALAWVESGDAGLDFYDRAHVIDDRVRDATAAARIPSLTGHDRTALPLVLAAIVDAKCPFTAEHSLRVAAIARRLGEILRLGEESLDLLDTAGLLHDVGKLAIPDEIINKPGPLDVTERDVMRNHARYSYDVISRLPGFETVAQLASWHHERLDGTGYPYGISGAALPIEARILGVADVFQALAQRRAYRPALEVAQVRQSLASARASQALDPKVLDALDTQFGPLWELASGDIALCGVEPAIAALCHS